MKQNVGRMRQGSTQGGAAGHNLMVKSPNVAVAKGPSERSLNRELVDSLKALKS